MTLKYIGPTHSDGAPARNLTYDGLPEGDLDETTLTDDQIKLALKSGLYEQKASKGAKEKES